MEKSIDEVLEMHCTYDDEGNLKRDAFMKKKEKNLNDKHEANYQDLKNYIHAMLLG